MKGQSLHAPNLKGVVFLFVSLVLAASCPRATRVASAQGVASSSQGVVIEYEGDEVAREAFDEVRGMRRVMLVTSKSLTADARGPARGVIEEVFQRPEASLRRHDYAYQVIAKRLNRYIRRHRTMTAVENLAEADFVIVFKVLNEQPSFIPTQPHVYGEMFVILNRSATRPRPVIVWWTKHNQTSIERAVKDFLEDLRELRGEK